MRKPKIVKSRIGGRGFIAIYVVPTSFLNSLYLRVVRGYRRPSALNVVRMRSIGTKWLVKYGSYNFCTKRSHAGEVGFKGP